MTTRTTYHSTYSTTTVQSMQPAEPQPPSKRKALEEDNPLANAAKKAKKDNSNASKKRKQPGEQQLGGLVIVRATSAEPTSEKPPSSSQPPSHPQSVPARPPSVGPNGAGPPPGQPPAAKKFRAESQPYRVNGKGKEREIPVQVRPDHELEEDVRRMNDEADDLRRRSQANAELNSANQPRDFKFPPLGNVRPSRAPSADRSGPSTSSQALAPRGRKPNATDETRPVRRKSSISRGKRASMAFETSGVIAQPHATVPDSSFYKHIDADMPESQRARQLLIWCSSRTMTRTLKARDGQGTSHDPGKDPPLLSDAAARLLKGAQEDVTRMLAEKKIDTTVVGGMNGNGVNGSGAPLKENEQNVKNREREVRFTQLNERAEAEERAWIAAAQFYELHKATVEAELSQERKDRIAAAKGKGKGRAVDDNWDARQHELPEHFRGRGGVELAREILQEDMDVQSPLTARMQGSLITVDRIEYHINSSIQTTRTVEEDLNQRFARLFISLSSRTQPTPPDAPPYDPRALSWHVPPSLSRPPPTPDPREVLFALSREDAQRQPSKVGDAARRAMSEVKRVEAAGGGGIADRKLTATPKVVHNSKMISMAGRGR